MDIQLIDSGLCIDGFKAYGVRDGKWGLACIVNESVCATAAVFTTSSIKGGHIPVTEEKVTAGLRAMIVNSGNANAYVKEAVSDAHKMCKIASERLGIPEDQIGVASTGITGRRIDLGKIEELTKKLVTNIIESPEGSLQAAQAIMTTDTKPKQLSFEYKGIKIGVIGKGSGMIAPNLATMLCFITTNADLEREDLQLALERSVKDSFNMLVIDGDMSPNDSVFLMSDRKIGCSMDDFQALLDHATREMTKMMAADGEGATKFLEVEVMGARSPEEARLSAKAVITSPLVKTAFYGENPNWGRIVAAIGAKIDIDLEKMMISFESQTEKVYVLENGECTDLKEAVDILRGDEIKVCIDLRQGEHSATCWGCDLSEEYVKINAGYN